MIVMQFNVLSVISKCVVDAPQSMRRSTLFLSLHDPVFSNQTLKKRLQFCMRDLNETKAKTFKNMTICLRDWNGTIDIYALC